MTGAAGRTLTQTALLKGNQMKNMVVALATGLMIVSLGMPISAAAQDSTTGTSVKDRKTVAYSLRMTAEVISVNRGAQALTVKTVDNGKQKDAILAVSDSAARVLDTLEPGDLVQVTYVRVNDQLRAQRIVKAEAMQRQ
jgi:hypothetical protein